MRFLILSGYVSLKVYVKVNIASLIYAITLT